MSHEVLRRQVHNSHPYQEPQPQTFIPVVERLEIAVVDISTRPSYPALLSPAEQKLSKYTTPDMQRREHPVYQPLAKPRLHYPKEALPCLGVYIYRA
jgi:hypothetical protein